jgi:dTDP-4-dehydrorhamnose 3,5-epimerase
MRFVATPLPGAYLIDLDRIEDERGFFARTFCRDEFLDHGLNPRLVQCSLSFNGARGTLRGMHFQVAPHEEAKLVRCTAGAIFDVIVDLRPGSPTRLRWFGAELSAQNHRMLYVPEGFAHGLLTLEDNSEVFYQISEFFTPECARGFRWDDPAIAIAWPQPVRIISDRDRSYPNWT